LGSLPVGATVGHGERRLLGKWGLVSNLYVYTCIQVIIKRPWPSLVKLNRFTSSIGSRTASVRKFINKKTDIVFKAIYNTTCC
jgi:hypothetical protein